MRILKGVVLILGIFAFGFLSAESTPHIIKELLERAINQDEKEKAATYLEVANQYQKMSGKMDSVQIYANLALEYSKKQKLDTIAINAYYRLGMVAWYKDQKFDFALDHFNAAKDIVIANKEYKNRLPRIDNAIGCIELITGKYDEALKTFRSAFDGASTIDNYEIMSMAGTNMGMIYIKMGDTTNCMKINEEAFERLDPIDDSSLSLTKVKILINLGDLYLKTKKYDKTQEVINKTNILLSSNNDFRQEGRLAILEARLLSQLGLKSKLYALVEQKIKGREQGEGYDREIYTSLLIYHGLGQSEKGNFNEARKIALELEGALVDSNNKHKLNLLKSLNDLHTNLKDYKSANHYLEDYFQLKDSLYNNKMQTQLMETEKRYELEKKERIIKEAQNNNLELKSFNSRLMLGGALLLLLGLLFYLKNYIKNQKEKERMNEIEQKILSLQMNPHFIFNGISSIQNFLYDGKDTTKAIIHLSTFASLMRQMLENSRERFIPLNSEIDFLTNYLKLQKLRFDNKFNYNIIVDSDVDIFSIAIPPLLTQPFIENAIEHGKIYHLSDGLLTIKISQIDDRLDIKIADNGTGITPEKNQDTKTEIKKKSLSIKITNERLSLLSKLMKKKWILNIKNQTERGTLVHFNIPKVSIGNL